MFSDQDIQQITQRGSALETVRSQIENFKKGFPFLPIKEAASVGNGIIKLSEEDLEKRIAYYDEKVAAGTAPLKFVPASGAASRMFKALFEALEACENQSEEEVLQSNKAAAQYIENLDKFAFSSELKEKIAADGATENIKNKIDYLLSAKGLDYGRKPKGLLKFHSYENGARTPQNIRATAMEKFSFILRFRPNTSPDLRPCLPR